MQIDSLLVAKLDGAIEMVKSVAPEVWRIMVTQAIVEGVASYIFFVVAIIFGSVLVTKGRKMPLENYGMMQGCAIIYVLIGIVLLVAGITILGCNFAKPFNPEYYAIQSLLGR